MKRGADKAGCPVPPLVAHAPICVHQNKDEVMEAVNKQLGTYYLRLPFYVQMFVAAGYPEATSGAWSEDMLNAVVPWGKEEKVTDGLRKLFDMGASEIIVTPVLAGKDKAVSMKRAVNLVAEMAREGKPKKR